VRKTLCFLRQLNWMCYGRMGQRVKGEGRTFGVDRTRRDHEEFCGLYGNLVTPSIPLAFTNSAAQTSLVWDELQLLQKSHDLIRNYLIKILSEWFLFYLSERIFEKFFAIERISWGNYFWRIFIWTKIKSLLLLFILLSQKLILVEYQELIETDHQWLWY